MSHQHTMTYPRPWPKSFAKKPGPPLKIPPVPPQPLPVCLSRSGVGRREHEYDKDGLVCIFCDARSEG